jgi:pimeloyl-ACP methyl ester carboxylesterase
MWCAMPACCVLAGDTPQTTCSLLRPQDQLWLISNRGLGCDLDRQFQNLNYWRFDSEKRWVKSSLAELKDAEKHPIATTIFVHGNRISSSEAFPKGLSAYRALVQCADDIPVRFIVWSWPSEPIDGLVDDARIKAARTTPAAYYLAWFIDQLSSTKAVGLWGHSYGARIITGALHVLGGGRLGGYRPLALTHKDREKMRGVLVASALDNDWLLEGRFHGRAMKQVDRILLVNNSCDAVLKRYHWIYDRRACQQALGYTGLAGGRLMGDTRGKIIQIDACCQIGRDHMLAAYLCAPGLLARMRDQLLHRPSDEPNTSSETLAAVK